MKQILFTVCTIIAVITKAQTTNYLCSKGHFPDTWDKNHDLRGNRTKVLAWTHKKDDQPFELKICITLLISSDSLGKPLYYISEKYTNEKPFNKWYTASIHYAPKEGQVFGFHDLHLEEFDHKPSKIELYELLNHWEFNLNEKDWQTIECGIDEQLWLDSFGFIPNQSFTIK